MTHSILLQAFPSGPFSTNAYIVACSQTRQAAVIDPAPGSFTVMSAYIQEHRLKLTSIFLTHSHWDHIADLSLWLEHYPIPFFVHPKDAPNVEKPGSDGVPFWIAIPPVTVHHLLHDQETFTVGNVGFKILHTPGHSPGSCVFFSEEENLLLSGDTLFKGAIGNTSFPGSDSRAMQQSLEKLFLLPLATQVFPGHGPPTTLQEEQRHQKRL